MFKLPISFQIRKVILVALKLILPIVLAIICPAISFADRKAKGLVKLFSSDIDRYLESPLAKRVARFAVARLEHEYFGGMRVYWALLASIPLYTALALGFIYGWQSLSDWLTSLSRWLYAVVVVLIVVPYILIVFYELFHIAARVAAERFASIIKQREAAPCPRCGAKMSYVVTDRWTETVAAPAGLDIGYNNRTLGYLYCGKCGLQW